MTFKDLFTPYIGSSTIASVISNTSLETPKDSFPTTIAIGNSTFNLDKGILLLFCSIATICIFDLLALIFYIAKTAVSAYSHSTHCQVLIEAFLIFGLGGV